MSKITVYRGVAKGNQITVVAFQSVQLAQALFLQKNQTLQNNIFYFWFKNEQVERKKSEKK